jgi:hypothetical protein
MQCAAGAAFQGCSAPSIDGLNGFEELRRDYRDLQAQTRKLAEFKTHLFWYAVGGALIAGMILEGLFSLFMGWGR